jgi:hypothetical protein
MKAGDGVAVKGGRCGTRRGVRDGVGSCRGGVGAWVRQRGPSPTEKVVIPGVDGTSSGQAARCRPAAREL